MNEKRASHKVLEEIKQKLEEMSVVPTPVPAEENTDVIDSFLADSVAAVMSETGLDEDSAVELVFDLAEAGEVAQLLPSLPGSDASEEERQAWLGAASETEFTLQAVLAASEG